MVHKQRKSDKADTKNAHLIHTDTISEDEENISGTEGEDSEVDLLADVPSAPSHSTTDDVIPTISSPLASVSIGGASVLSSVGRASSSIVKLGPSDQVLTEDPDGMPRKLL